MKAIKDRVILTRIMAIKGIKDKRYFFEIFVGFLAS